MLPAPIKVRDTLSLREMRQAGRPRYIFHRRKRSALPMTMRSDKPIAAAQITGLRKPNAASGMDAAL